MKKNAIVYFTIVALDSISYGLIAPILAPLLTSHNSFFFSNHSALYQYWLYGIFIGIFPFTYMISAPFLGLLSDRYGRKKVLLACLTITLTTFICYAFAFTFKIISLLIIARILAGLSAGSQGVAQAAVADFSDEKNKPHMISIIAIGMSLGLIIGPLAACMWSNKFNYLPFIGTILFCLFCMRLLWRLPDNQMCVSQYSRASVNHLIKIPGIYRLLAVFLLFELGWSLYLQSMPLFLNLTFHLQTRQIGLVNALIGSALALCLLTGTRIFSKFTQFNLISTTQLGLTFGLITLFIQIVKIPLWAFLISALPMIFAVALIYPCIISQLSTLVAKENQGLLMGITDGLIALAFTVTGFLSSVLIYFNVNAVFWLAAICWIICGSILWRKLPSFVFNYN